MKQVPTAINCKKLNFKKTVTEKCYIVSVGNKFKTEISSVSNIKSLRMTIMT